jgi:hypothetical protein
VGEVKIHRFDSAQLRAAGFVLKYLIEIPSGFDPVPVELQNKLSAALYSGDETDVLSEFMNGKTSQTLFA